MAEKKMDSMERIMACMKDLCVATSEYCGAMSDHIGKEAEFHNELLRGESQASDAILILDNKKEPPSSFQMSDIINGLSRIYEGISFRMLEEGGDDIDLPGGIGFVAERATFFLSSLGVFLYSKVSLGMDEHDLEGLEESCSSTVEGLQAGTKALMEGMPRVEGLPEGLFMEEEEEEEE